MTAARVLLTALHLLDHQLVDADGTLVGKVDDVEIQVDRDEGAHLGALLSGPGVLASRLGHTGYGRWRERMEHDIDGPSGRTARIPVAAVRSFDATIQLNLPATQLAPYGSERWVAEHVIGHIPGSGVPRHEDDSAPAVPAARGLEHEVSRTIRASSLLGRSVTDQSDEPVGIVLDIRLVQDGIVGADYTAKLRVDGLIVGHGRFPQRSGLLRHQVHGPWLLKAIAGRIGPDRRYLRWDDVENPTDILSGASVAAAVATGPLPG